jgi:uncharacterized protein YybS (DUF2232 family)
MTKFLSIMETIGKDALKGLSEVEKYLPSAAALAAIIFPGQTATISAVVTSTDLVQKAVVAVEQKMAAAGKTTGTGSQKLSDVLTIVTPTVTQLFAQAGLTVDQTYLTKVVNAVVAVLNVQASTVAATPAPATK